MKNIKIEGVKIFKDDVHVWNAGSVYDLSGWKACFSETEIKFIALELAKSQLMCSYKWHKGFDWGIICTSKNGNKTYFPENLRFEIRLEDATYGQNVCLFVKSSVNVLNKSKTDVYGFVNKFTETKHSFGGEWKEVFHIGSLNDNLDFLN